MKFPLLPVGLLLCLAASAQTPDIGSGAPTEAIHQSFIRTYFRNNFNNLVSTPPLGDVKKLGTLGLVQEFADAAKNQTNKYAIVKSNASAPSIQFDADIFQIYPGLYSYYTALGPTNAGYPTSDTLNCPTLVNTPNNSCQYQFFDKPYVLFAFKNQVQGNGVNFGVTTPFYAKWVALGGISAAGPAVSAAQNITSASGIAATYQTFDQGAIFNITSGTLSGRLIAVGPGVYSAYAASGGYTGFLGLPILDEQILANGHHRQSFEGGSIEYDPAGGGPMVRLPILSISVTPSPQSLKLNLGDTVTLTATPFDANGNQLTDRTLVWSTSNSRVLQIQASGATATVKAIGGGSATLTVSAEGKTSTPIPVLVTAPCCGIGEGAPTPDIQQAFLDAVSRNRLTLALPAALPVRRVGGGYVQDFQDASGADYLVAMPDRSASAYVVSGALLAKYVALGGPPGSLGYPVSDATSGGRQLFSGQAALAGNPVQLVSGAIYTKWAALGFEAGSAGVPTSAATPVLSFQATVGAAQNFSKGVMVAQGAKAYFVAGPIAAAYNQAGGPTGAFGLPAGDEYTSGATHHQDFEGGYFEFTAGDASAQPHIAPRSPSITATPSAVLAGTHLRLAASGFFPGASLRISITGQADFVVKTDSGAYVWDTVVPAAAKSGAVTVRAVDVTAGSTASATYTVRTLGEVHLQLVKAAGDAQTGLPGAVLANTLDLQVRDDAGLPVAGIPVQFSASPGAAIVSASPVTDSNGVAHAALRLPSVDGISLATAQAGRDSVTFTAQALHGALQSFPKMTSPADLAAGPGSLLASVASILRFYQNRGDIPAPNGVSDTTVLAQFLKGFCAGNTQGAQICDGYLTTPGGQQLVNLWRLGAFAGGNLEVSILKPDLNAVRDQVGQGYPVLVELAGQDRWAVVAGIGGDGSLTALDPSSISGTVNLTSIAGAVLLKPGAVTGRGFLVSGTPGFQIGSPAGDCPILTTKDLAFAYCSGAQGGYEIDTAAGAFQLTVTDLANPGSRTALAGNGASSYLVSQNGTQWTPAPLQTSFTAAGVVNAASYTSEIAPGGLFTVFGTGLARAGSDTTIQVGDQSAPVVAQAPFQVSAMVPAGLAPGVYPVTVASAYGSAVQSITLLAAAPAIFVVVNQDGSLNTPDNPAARGSVLVIYCTGLGVTVPRATLSVTVQPVTGVLAGTALRVAFSGLTPGFKGLYQVNLPIPAATPPGLNLMLSLQEADRTSNTVAVAIQ